jgi:hypothetical protein
MSLPASALSRWNTLVDLSGSWRTRTGFVPIVSQAWLVGDHAQNFVIVAKGAREAVSDLCHFSAASPTISRPTVVVVCMPWLLRIMGCPNSARINGTLVPVEKPSTASTPVVTGLQSHQQGNVAPFDMTELSFCACAIQPQCRCQFIRHSASLNCACMEPVAARLNVSLSTSTTDGLANVLSSPVDSTV